VSSVPTNRIVALFAPFIALAAGVTATWLTDHVTGLQVSPGQLEAIFIATLTAVLAPAAQWLHGSQKLARIEAELERAALAADTRAAELAGEHDLEAHREPDDDYDEYDADGLDDDYAAALDEPDAVPAGA
jgi:hypothetical protein